MDTFHTKNLLLMAINLNLNKDTFHIGYISQLKHLFEGHLSEFK